MQSSHSPSSCTLGEMLTWLTGYRDTMSSSSPITAGPPRPHSTSFAHTSSPSPRKHSQGARRPNSMSSPAPTPKRQPLGAISVQTFQDRHRTEFAHLHTHSNDSLREKRLEAEKAELERARREGREKRESLKAARLAAEVARNSESEGKGRRPLSLLVKQTGNGGGRREGERPTSAPLALLSPRASVKRGGRGSLNVVVESDSRADLSVVPAPTPTADNDSPADTSISQSSYSWASQFSGETEELRTAARYIPRTAGQEEDEEQEELADDEEEVLASSPEQGVYRRRKKIVALAHTVRQLEGVGSREAEDPAFFAVLEKAWNERPVGTAPGPGTVSSDNGSSPYTPNLSSRHSDNYPAYASSAYGKDKDDSASSIDTSTRRSQSVRYSYASTLHDLALDGGIEQANRIFLAKPWLRASIVSTTGAGDGVFGSNYHAKPSGPSPSYEPGQGQGYPAGDIRRLSLASSPPPFGSSPAVTATGLTLASPITLQRAEIGQDHDQSDAQAFPPLRKVTRTVDGASHKTAGSDDKTIVDEANLGSNAETAAEAQLEAQARPHSSATSGWGLGFVSDWFGSAGADGGAGSAETSAKAPAANSTATPLSHASAPFPRSTTVAQFDDAPNDDSLVDVDAEGETDDGQYDYASEGEDEYEPGQVFHERRGGGEVSDPNPNPDTDPYIQAQTQAYAMPTEPMGEAAEAETQTQTQTRPESTILPSGHDSPRAKATAKSSAFEGDTSVDSVASSNLNPSLGPDRSQSTTDINIDINASPSSNPSQPLICSTHSITSYQPTLVHLPTNIGLGLGLTASNADQAHQVLGHPEAQTAVIEEEELLSSRAGSCRSSASCSSPSKRTKRASSASTSTSTKPVLAPIQTTLARLEGDSLPNPSLRHDSQTVARDDTLKVHLSDERFSNAYKLAQSIRVPTPSIRSPTRQSSINVLSTLFSPTLTSTSPTGDTPDMEISSRWFSQDSSEDAELMMGAVSAPSPSPSTSVSARTSPTTFTRPLGPARTRSSSTSIVAFPAQVTPNSPATSTASLPKSMRRPSRPNLLDTRAHTLSSISELELRAAGAGAGAGGNALAPSDTLNSISGGSEVLSDLNGNTGVDDPLSASLSDLSMSARRSRLGQASLDSLPSYLRPPSISDSIDSSSIGGRRNSNYQAYQQRHIERNRRANARVAAKMAGASAKELKQLQQQQHQSMVLGNGSPNPAQMESQSIMIMPEPSRAACVLFFLGFVLGPWFWIFGGWMPLGHSSEIKKDEETSLDFTAADHLPRGWRWTYHPDPWVKRNRRAAAIVIPIMVVGGVAAAIAVAVVFGAA